MLPIPRERAEQLRLILCDGRENWRVACASARRWIRALVPTITTARRWIRARQKVRIGGYEIAHGMIYVGHRVTVTRRRGEPASRDYDIEHIEQVGRIAVDPTLPIASRAADLRGESLPAQPSYADISPPARATYLNWLASERSDKRIGGGYVLLYFYGLEHRFFVDSPPDKEKTDLLAEVKRLFKVYGNDRALRRHLDAFREIAEHVLRHKLSPRFVRYGDDMPYDLRAAIGILLRNGQALPAEWLLSWYICHPKTKLPPPARLAFPEFKALFIQLCTAKFPQGLPIQIQQLQPLQVVYTAASGVFRVTIKNSAAEIPDILALHEPLAIADALAVEANDALSSEASALLPDKIVLDDQKIASLHDNTKQAAALLGEIFDDDGPEPERREEETAHNGLDEKHAAFLDEVLQRKHWRIDELTSLAGKSELMAGGAVETLNDWSVDKYEDLLLEEEEDGSYLINAEIAANITNDLQGE